MKIEFEGELTKAKQTLDLERQNVREVINSEVQQEKERFRSEIKLLKSLLHAEEAKNAEITQRHAQAQEYAETLESRLADSEVAQEEVQLETVRLQKEIDLLKIEIQQRAQVEKELKAEIDGLSQQGQSSVEHFKTEMLKKVDEAKYEMFQHLMDAFEQERCVFYDPSHFCVFVMVLIIFLFVCFCTGKCWRKRTITRKACCHKQPRYKPFFSFPPHTISPLFSSFSSFSSLYRMCCT